MIKAIAVDDEPVALDIIGMHAEKVPFLQLEAKFVNAITALEYLNQHETDLLFLDIKMPDISGIDFYNSLVKKPSLIFTTAYSEHAVTGFDLEATDYLLKPITFPRFLRACNKVQETIQKNRELLSDHIFIKDGYTLIKIHLDEILFIEATGNYLKYVLKNKQILTRSTMKEALETLPPARFIQVHRSFIVNSDQVQRIERHQLILAGQTIPISSSYIGNVLSRFQE